MGLSVARFQPTVRIDQVNLGEAEGFLAGARAGASRGAGIGLDLVSSGSCEGSICGAALIVGLALVLGSAAVGALIEGEKGKQNSLPPGVGRQQLNDAAVAMRRGSAQKYLGAKIAQAAERQASVRLARLGATGPSRSSGYVDYHGYSNRALRSVLEASLMEIGLTGARYNDQRLAFQMRGRIRIFDVNSGSEVYSREVTTTGARRHLAEWSSYNARFLNAEVETGYRRLAEAIVDEVFLIWTA